MVVLGGSELSGDDDDDSNPRVLLAYALAVASA